MRITMLLIAAAVAAGPSPLGAQLATPPAFRWDFTLGNGNGLTSASIGVLRTRDVLPGDRLRIGLGLRSTYVRGDVELTPAGATNVPAGIVDTLRLNAGAIMLNVSGHLGIVITKRLEAGLNIDLAGFGGGPSVAAAYQASPGGAVAQVDASPSSTNIFLYGSKDRGSLNSEFFAAWAATDRLTIRGGLSHQLVEYSAERNLSSNTDRFRQYVNLLFLGVRLAR